jgi:hypothetical protein
MPRLVIWSCWALLVLILMSCASPQARLLRVATNHETQAVVAEHLGQPDEVWPLADGEMLWSYRADQRLWAYWHKGRVSGSTGGITVEGPGLTVLPSGRCTEYVLRFDREQILRAWNRQPCQGFTIGQVAQAIQICTHDGSGESCCCEVGSRQQERHTGPP